MDWSVVHSLNGVLARHDAVEDPLNAYVGASEIIFAVLVVVLLLVGTRELRRGAVSAAVAAAVALAIGDVISHVVDRARPFVAHPHGIHLFSAHAADAGFPSDHATASFAIAVALLLRHRALGIVALVLAALLSFGRVALGFHYPSDVIAGAALGAAVALGLCLTPVRRLLDAGADALGRVIAGALRRGSTAVAGERAHGR